MTYIESYSGLVNGAPPIIIIADFPYVTSLLTAFNSLGYPFGTFTLIEIDSFMNLVQHFQTIYTQTSDTYEIIRSVKNY